MEDLHEEGKLKVNKGRWKGLKTELISLKHNIILEDDFKLNRRWEAEKLGFLCAA